MAACHTRRQTNYSCVNCCGNSFYDGWLTPGSTFGFAGDEMENNSNAAGQELLWSDILALPRLGNIQRRGSLHLRPIFRFDDFIRPGTNFALRSLESGFVVSGCRRIL